MAAAPTVEHAREAPRTRVLVVDDDAAVADSTGLWLEMEGYDTRVARSGPAAMEEAQQFEPHIVLLDIGLSGMDATRSGSGCVNSVAATRCSWSP